MKSFLTMLIDEDLAGGAFVGGSAFIGGGIFTGGGTFFGGGAFIGGGRGDSYFSLVSEGMNSVTTLGSAAGGGLHSGSGKFAQGFSSESLGEKVDYHLRRECEASPSSWGWRAS